MEKLEKAAVQLEKESVPLLTIFILGGLTAFGPLNTDMYLPGFPAIAADFQTNASLVQLTLTGGLLGLAGGQLFAGPLSDVHGRRIWLIVSLVVYALTSVLCAIAPNIHILIGLRIIQGVAGGAGIVIARACVRDLYSGPQLTKMFSLLVLIMGVAPILAPVAGGYFLNFVSWRGIFIILFGLGIVMLLLVIYRLPETLPNEKRSSGGLQEILIALQTLRKDRLFIGYSLTMGFGNGAMFAYISASPFVIQEIFQVTPQGFSFIFAINAMGLIIASQITGRMAGIIEEIVFLRIGLVMLLTGGLSLLLFTLIETGVIPVLIAFFLIVTSTGFLSPSCTALAMNSQSEHVGSASAIIGVLTFGMGGIVAPLVGIQGSASAMPLSFIVAICGVSAILIYFLMIRTRRIKDEL